MDTHDYLLENRHFLIPALAGLVEVEQQRIIKDGIATKSQLNALSDVAEYLVDLAKKRKRTNIPLNALANLCTMLKSIQLPGDFETYTVGSPGKLSEEFYVALDLPYEGEQFYDISCMSQNIANRKSAESKDDDKEKDDDKHPEECDCMDCMDCIDAGPNVLVGAVSQYLKKVAKVLSDDGNHEAAYLVERSIRSIQVKADIFDEMGQMEKNPPRNVAPQQRMVQQYQQRKQQQPQQQQFQQLWQQQQQAQQPQAQPQQAQQPQQQPQQQPAQPQKPTLPQAPKQPAQPAQQQKQQPAQRGRRQMRKTSPKVQKFWQSATPQQKANFKQLRRKNMMQPMDSIVDMVLKQR